jgi:hypothetical protein
MMGKIVASIVVRFGDGADSSAFFKVELDNLINLDDSGEPKRSFAPGDKINFLVQHGPELRIREVRATDGQISDSGQVVRQREDSFLFAANEATQQLSYLTTDRLDIRWYGRQAAELRRSDRDLTASGGSYPCRALLKYHAPFHGFALHAPEIDLAEDETYPVDIVVYFDEVSP